MIRLIAVALALAVATSAQAMTLTPPLHQPDGMITQVREACGAGRVRINGVCVAGTTKRQVRRCAVWGAGHVSVGGIETPPNWAGSSRECAPFGLSGNGSRLVSYQLKVSQKVACASERGLMPRCAQPTLNYLIVIASPLRSAFAISPTCRPDSSRIAPFWLVSTIARTPPPSASPAPAAA